MARFKQYSTKIYAISVDPPEIARETQQQYPGIRIVADPDRRMANAFRTVHEKAGPAGEDIHAPTTLLVDREGTILWTHRPDRVLTRLTPDQLLAKVAEHVRPRE